MVDMAMGQPDLLDRDVGLLDGGLALTIGDVHGRHLIAFGLKDAGAQIIETQLPGLAALIDLTTDAVQNHDVRIALAHYLEKYGTGVTFETLISQASPPENLRRWVELIDQASEEAVKINHKLRQVLQESLAANGPMVVEVPITKAVPPLL